MVLGRVSTRRYGNRKDVKIDRVTNFDVLITMVKSKIIFGRHLVAKIENQNSLFRGF